MPWRNHIYLASAILAAACAQPARQEATAPATPDTAAVRTALNALADEFEGHLTAGHASAVAGMWTESGTATFYGFPTAVGRPAIESLYAGLLGATRVTDFQITMTDVAAPGPDRATAVGTGYQVAASSGRTSRTWFRWAAAYSHDASGQWRLAYVMAFPDSAK